MQRRRTCVAGPTADDGVLRELAEEASLFTQSTPSLSPAILVVLCVSRSSDSLSPPPSQSDSPAGSSFNSPPYSGHSQNGFYPSSGSSSKKVESLVKQTYSTTMTHPVTGKVKKFHVVAYSSKVDHIVCVSAMLILFSTIREGMLTTPFPSPISFLLWRTSRLLLESGQSGKPDATSIIPSVARRVEDRWDPARIRLPSPLFRRRTVQQPS